MYAFTSLEGETYWSEFLPLSWGGEGSISPGWGGEIPRPGACRLPCSSDWLSGRFASSSGGDLGGVASIWVVGTSDGGSRQVVGFFPAPGCSGSWVFSGLEHDGRIKTLDGGLIARSHLKYTTAHVTLSVEHLSASVTSISAASCGPECHLCDEPSPREGGRERYFSPPS